MASAAKKCAARCTIMSLWWAGLCPNRGRFFGRGTTAPLVLDPQRQAALVELLDDFLQRLLAEVRDGEEILLRLLDELADGVDLGPLQAVARALREVELLDRQVELGRRRRRHGGVAQLEAPSVGRHLGDEVDERAQRLARRRQGVG